MKNINNVPEFLPQIKDKYFLDKKKIYEFGISEQNESIHDVFNRVSSAIAKVESDSKFSSSQESADFQKEITTLLNNQKFIPSTTILMNAGRFNEMPLSACAVPPVDLRKDIEGVKKSVDDFHFCGMGTGFNFDDIENPIKLIEYLNQIGIDGQNNEKQLRPVGNMGTLSVDHLKILEFIRLKSKDLNKQWVFNFSINISNENLDKIKKREYITLKDGSTIEAEQLLTEIAKLIHKTGDPGLVFIDRLNDDNQVPSAGRYQSLAPCGEVGLSAGETCQFSYINLGEFANEGWIDYEQLEKTIALVTRFLDDIVEYNISRFSSDTSKNIAREKRKIGLGVCGFADLLSKLNLQYDSDEARSIAENLFSFINYVSKKASVELAKKRGFFGKFNESKYLTNNNLITKYANRPTEKVSEQMWTELAEEIKVSGIRNSATIALPPTGRSSLLIGASQSVEPYFKDILSISPEKQLLMVDTIQKFVDESISKTINVSNNTTLEQIKEIINKSIDSSLKGITLYRDGSRIGQPTKLSNN